MKARQRPAESERGLRLVQGPSDDEAQSAARRRLTRQDSATIERAVAGDRAAMLALEKRVRPVIRSRVNYYLRNRRPPRIGLEDAEDLAQAIWLELVKDGARVLREYNPELGMSLPGYVSLICRRELFRRTRALGAAVRGGQAQLVAIDGDVGPASTQSTPEETVEERQLLGSLWAHLRAELPPRGQLVMAALYEDGLSVADTATLIGASTQVVYNWQHKIRTIARAFVQEQSA